MKANKNKPRPSEAIIEIRIQAVLQIRLDGAEGWDVRQFVAEKEAAGEQPWRIEEGQQPLSERSIRRYVQDADKRIAESGKISRQASLRRHLAQRRSLYARAVQSGDLRTALSVLSDLASLQDLYPAKRIKAEHSGKIGHTYDGLTDDELKAEVERLAKLCQGDVGAESPPSPE